MTEWDRAIMVCEVPAVLDLGITASMMTETHV